ncbi:MAG: AraC family transcriptional regulator [bacterium]
MNYKDDSAPAPLNVSFIIEQKKRVNESYNSTLHYHNSYELYYLLDGERDYFIKDRTYHVKKGDIIMINQHDIHRTIYTGSYQHERILIKFKDDFIKTITRKNKNENFIIDSLHRLDVLRLNIDQQIFVENILHKMLSEYNKQKEESTIYLKILLTELLIAINRYSKNAKTIEHPNLIHEKVSEIVKYINNNYHEDLNVDILTKKFSISPSYLSTIFKEITSFTITQYINGVRIKEAQRILRSTNMNITDISSRVGFNSLTHFGRVFKQNTDLSPSEYRKIKKIN